MRVVTTLCVVVLLLSFAAHGLARPETEFKVFQFPANQIPRIDGDTSDWDAVPDDYAIGLDQLNDTERGHGVDLDPKDFDLSVKVGWVKGLNRLYFLYEAYDDCWDFDRPDLSQDIFELVVDGDLSGGPFIKHMSPHREQLGLEELHFTMHGVHAQNYHIFTPAKDKDWAMVWGGQPWIKDFPWANAAYAYDFKSGESGKLTMEFWITPFDHAPYEGPGRAIVTELMANERIGMSWCVLEYDNHEERFHLFANLAHDTEMIRNADALCAFRLMPLEDRFREPVEADWSFKVIDMDRRLVAFQDASHGEITRWHWDFGDGQTSGEQHPLHQYQKAGEWVVILDVEGPKGTARRGKVWDVVTK